MTKWSNNAGWHISKITILDEKMRIGTIVTFHFFSSVTPLKIGQGSAKIMIWSDN